MQTRTYTLKEAVFALNRSGSAAEASRISRHIRHWTSMDLVKPIGQKHTGTGRSREYPAEEIRRAAVLVELAKWRVPMTVLADTFENFTLDFEEEWETAALDTVPVYLVMSWGQNTAVWKMTLDEPVLRLIQDPPDRKHESHVIDGVIDVPASAIVINLSRLLRWVKL